MTDELKERLEQISKMMDGAISVTLIYDSNNKTQKLFMISVERVAAQQKNPE